MKKYTDPELNAILDDLNGGAVYVGICNGCGSGKIYAPNNNYLRWTHYGSSSNKNTLQDLRWILENIFDDCSIITPAIYSKYHLNYIPVDASFRAIDLSWMHPNVYGL